MVIGLNKEYTATEMQKCRKFNCKFTDWVDKSKKGQYLQKMKKSQIQLKINETYQDETELLETNQDN